MNFRSLVLGCLGAAVVACASNTIAPSYSTSNPDIRIGGERPLAAAPTVENAGSYCLAVSEAWHQDGQTPDGQALWARDTRRKVVPCE